MGGIYRIKPRFQRALSGIASRLTACHVHPDILTAAALGVALAGGGALYASCWAPGCCCWCRCWRWRVRR